MKPLTAADVQSIADNVRENRHEIGDKLSSFTTNELGLLAVYASGAAMDKDRAAFMAVQLAEKRPSLVMMLVAQACCEEISRRVNAKSENEP